MAIPWDLQLLWSLVPLPPSYGKPFNSTAGQVDFLAKQKKDLPLPPPYRVFLFGHTEGLLPVPDKHQPGHIQLHRPHPLLSSCLYVDILYFLLLPFANHHL